MADVIIINPLPKILSQIVAKFELNKSDFNYYIVGDSVGKAWNIGNKYKE